MTLALAPRTPVAGLLSVLPPQVSLVQGAPKPAAQPDQRRMLRTEKFRSHTKKGPGRMPHTRSSRTARTSPELRADWLMRAAAAVYDYETKLRLDEPGDRTYSITEYNERKRLIATAKGLEITVGELIRAMIEDHAYWDAVLSPGDET